jgi:hypothetical protein
LRLKEKGITVMVPGEAPGIVNVRVSIYSEAVPAELRPALFNGLTPAAPRAPPRVPAAKLTNMLAFELLAFPASEPPLEADTDGEVRQLFKGWFREL